MARFQKQGRGGKNRRPALRFILTTLLAIFLVTAVSWVNNSRQAESACCGDGQIAAGATLTMQGILEGSILALPAAIMELLKTVFWETLVKPFFEADNARNTTALGVSINTGLESLAKIEAEVMAEISKAEQKNKEIDETGRTVVDTQRAFAKDGNMLYACNNFALRNMSDILCDMAKENFEQRVLSDVTKFCALAGIKDTSGASFQFAILKNLCTLGALEVGTAANKGPYFDICKAQLGKDPVEDPFLVGYYRNPVSFKGTNFVFPNKKEDIEAALRGPAPGNFFVTGMRAYLTATLGLTLRMGCAGKIEGAPTFAVINAATQNTNTGVDREACLRPIATYIAQNAVVAPGVFSADGDRKYSELSKRYANVCQGKRYCPGTQVTIDVKGQKISYTKPNVMSCADAERATHRDLNSSYTTAGEAGANATSANLMAVAHANADTNQKIREEDMEREITRSLRECTFAANAEPPALRQTIGPQ
jgi:hypothetical protein